MEPSWAHILADINEAIFDKENDLKKIKRKLSVDQALLPFVQEDQISELQKRIQREEYAVEKGEAKLQQLRIDRDEHKRNKPK